MGCRVCLGSPEADPRPPSPPWSCREGAGAQEGPGADPRPALEAGTQGRQAIQGEEGVLFCSQSTATQPFAGHSAGSLKKEETPWSCPRRPRAEPRLVEKKVAHKHVPCIPATAARLALDGVCPCRERGEGQGCPGMLPESLTIKLGFASPSSGRGVGLGGLWMRGVGGDAPSKISFRMRSLRLSFPPPLLSLPLSLSHTHTHTAAHTPCLLPFYVGFH